MAKRLEVVLNQTVNKLGKRGELVEVAPGYARNYLVPQGLAVYATKGLKVQVEQRKQKELERIASVKKEAEARKTALQTIGRFVIKKQLGEKEAIFGTVTTSELAEAILASSKIEVDRREITLPDISKLGFYKAEVKLHPEVTAEIEVHVVPL